MTPLFNEFVALPIINKGFIFFMLCLSLYTLILLGAAIYNQTAVLKKVFLRSLKFIKSGRVYVSDWANPSDCRRWLKAR